VYTVHGTFVPKNSTVEENKVFHILGICL